VLNPIAELVAAVKERSGASVLVDAVSSLSAVELDFDALGADLVLAGVQKALALPPGVAVFALSERALEKAGRIPNRGWTTDFLRLREAMEKDQTPATPSVSHLFALEAQLERVLEEGLPARAARHRGMADRVAQWAGARGHELLAEEGFRSPTVTCLRATGPPPADLIRGVAERIDVQLGGGYGDLKPTHFRIGHMGEHRPEDLERVLEAIDGVVAGG